MFGGNVIGWEMNDAFMVDLYVKFTLSIDILCVVAVPE